LVFGLCVILFAVASSGGEPVRSAAAEGVTKTGLPMMASWAGILYLALHGEGIVYCLLPQGTP